MLAFSNDYYGMIFRATQSVELFCAYEVDKKLFSDSCRLLGETSISGGVTWDIAMELTLYKNGSYATSASKRSNQTSYYCAGTKYVSGKKSQFTGNGQFRVYDDNGVKIHSKSLYID